MFQKSLKSLEKINDLNFKLTIIIREEFKEKFQESIDPINMVLLKEKTRGPLDTVLKMGEMINDDDGLLIMDCDLSFYSKEYFDFIRESLASSNLSFAGALPWFCAQNPIYCFASLRDGLVTELAEKKRISPYAVAGAYYFSRGQFFKRSAGEVANNCSNGELFISSVYQNLIKNNFQIKAFKLDEYYSFGTPKELECYLKGEYGNY
jgi:dTDP-glucose pyrophosphorylase